jgi:hypothetical protein
MNSIQLNHITKISLTGAEISDFDPKSNRLFVTGEAAGKPVIQVIDGANPQQLTKITDIDLSTIGAGVQSVAVRKGTGNANSIIAVAISANVSTNNGKVAFFDAATLTKLSEVEVGALPDMLTFTADGSKLLVANEGEPNEDYSLDPEGSISIIDVSGNIASLNSNNVTTASFTTFNNQETTLKSQGVRIFGKLKSGNNSTVAQDLEPEYIAISPDGKTAFITLQENNAFAVLDIATATITKIVPLGFKDHNLPGNGLDASDRDVNGTSAGGGKINIQNWPIFGMYQPDGISSFEIAGKTYYITANEGDARIRPTANNSFGSEGSLFNEESRISSLNLDPTAFPDATNLKNNANLGRLTVTNKLGDTDGDGDFDKLYAFGARSFSIWDDQGQLVFDSGDQLEQITKEITPNLFNANNGNTADFDTRSDNKGPEPESVTIGIIDGKTYGFIGLERSAGGVMVYDLSNPAAPIFIQYIYTTGDIAPEGLKFISAQDSPSGKPLLAVSNESSNTVSVYEIGLIKTGTAKGTINDDDIALVPIINNNIFTLRGTGETVRLKVTLISNSSNVVNELGIFSTDDNEGTIRRDDGISIKPGQQGYREAALERAKNQGESVFSAIANLPDLFKTEIQTNNLIRILEFDSGTNLQFFLVTNGTIDGFRSGVISNSNVIFADFSTQKITQENQSYILSWKESSTAAEFNSLVVRIESTQDPLEIGTAQKGESQAEIIDLTGIRDQGILMVKANFSVFREALFDNEVYFYKVDNSEGKIGTLTATAANRANYLQAAINNIISNLGNGEIIKFSVDNQKKFTDSTTIATGSILVPMIIVNGTLSQLTDNITSNDPQVYFPYLGLNSDGADHIRLLGNNIFGFEDLPNGGDLDYNDIIIKMNFTQIV